MDTTGAKKPVAEPIGLIGLGLVGMALAERLLGGGFAVWGYDIDPGRRDLLCRAGGQAASCATEVVTGCRRVLLSLPDSTVVREVVGEVEPCLGVGQIIVDTSTGDPDQAAALGQRLAGRGVSYLDATISGSSEQVRRGEAVVLAGGPAQAVEQCQDLFRQFACRWFHVGLCGSGSQMKLVSNLVLGLNRAALAEGLWLGQVLGLDPEMVLQVLRDSMAYSRIMDTKGPKMISEDFRPQARLSQHHKDVSLMLDAATKAGTDLPLSRTHAHLLELAEAAGDGALDNSAIIRVFARLGSPRASDEEDRQAGGVGRETTE